MVINCSICYKPYTYPGSEHAPYSAKCGHLIGKSCLEMWRKSKLSNNFTCPVCHTVLKHDDYYPIYGLTDEPNKQPIKPENSLERFLTEHRVMRNYLKNEYDIQKEPKYIKKLDRDFFGKVVLYDIHNNFLLTICFLFLEDEGVQNLELYNIPAGERCFSKKLGSNKCTAIAFNKYKDDVIEFCIGFEDGQIQCMKYDLECNGYVLSGKICYLPQSILSICYLERDKIAFSTWNDGVFVAGTDNLTKRNNWAHIFEPSLKVCVKNVQKLNDTHILGIVNDSIYVFNGSDIPYLLYKNTQLKICDYTIDPKNMSLLVFSFSLVSSEDSHRIGMTYSFEKLLENFTLPCIECLNSKEYISIDEESNNVNKSMCFPPKLKPYMINVEFGGKSFVLTFLPNVLKNSICVCSPSSGKIYSEIILPNEDFEECLGVYCLTKPNLFLPGILKMELIVLFNDKYILFTYYCPAFNE